MRSKKVASPSSSTRLFRKRERCGRVQRDVVGIRACEHGVLYCVPPQRMAGRSAPARRGVEEQAVAIIEVSGTNFALRSAEDRQQVMAGYQALLKALPPDQSLQLLVRSHRQDLQTYLSRIEAVAANEDVHPTWKKLAAAHAAHIRHITENRTLLDRRFYLVLPSAPFEARQPWFARIPLRKVARRSPTISLQKEAVRKQLEVQCDNLIAQVVAMGLTARRLSDEEMVGLAYRCLTPQRAEAFPLPLPGFAPLADLLAPASVEERPDLVCVEGEYTRCITITDFPREVAVGWLAPLILDDSMIDIVQFFHPQNAHTMIRQYRRRKAEFRATRQINRKRGVVDDPEEEVAEGGCRATFSAARQPGRAAL